MYISRKEEKSTNHLRSNRKCNAQSAMQKANKCVKRDEKNSLAINRQLRIAIAKPINT